MKTTVPDLVKDMFTYGSASELMTVLREGAELVSTSTVPIEELDITEQAAITTLQVVLTFLTDFGVLEDVQILH
jgi:hypothetical protein